GLSGPLPAIGVRPGSPVHRPALLLPRRPGKPLPVLLLFIADLLRHPPRLTGDLRNLRAALPQFRAALSCPAAGGASPPDTGADAGGAGLGDVGEQRSGAIAEARRRVPGRAERYPARAPDAARRPHRRADTRAAGGAGARAAPGEDGGVRAA